MGSRSLAGDAHGGPRKRLVTRGTPKEAVRVYASTSRVCADGGALTGFSEVLGAHCQAVDASVPVDEPSCGELSERHAYGLACRSDHLREQSMRER